MCIQKIERIRVISSAKGIASQSPSSSKRAVIRKIPSKIKTKVREKEMKADVFPSERAVNIPEAKILIPENRNEKENRAMPRQIRS